MIIECVKCSKKFEVKSELIPSNGRTIQCGSCNHIWFFKNDIITEKPITSPVDKIKQDKSNKNIEKKIDKIINKKNQALVEFKKKTKFSFIKLLRYIIVIVISFVGLIIFLDTFKMPLNNIFPNLELTLFNLYELNKDILLFIKDLF
jgi:predicted Zn finger-like uncharacterized protein